MLTSWTRSEEANLGILNAKLRRELMHEIFMARFAGFTEVSVDKRGNKTYMPSGKPVEILRDFVTAGMDHMLIPMLRELTSAGIYGDKQLKGNEEKQSLYYNKVFINQVRNGIRRGGRASEQRLKALKMMKEDRPQLQRWLARIRDIQITKAFYEGWSPQITAATGSGGLYIGSGQKRNHPNFFTADAGKVAWNATDATHEASIYTALNNLTNTTTDYFTTSLIEGMRTEVQSLKIMPMNIGGEDYIPWLIHPNQARQLRRDSYWNDANQRAWVASMAKDNPIFKGAIGQYAGFIFYERLLGVFGADISVADTVTYGSTNPLAALDTNARKCSIIFGANAISTGVASDAYLDTEQDDYGNIDGTSIGMITGDARGEFVDNTSTKTAIINQSSAIVATFSPAAFV